MSINTNIYGTQDTWIVTGGDHANINDCYMLANFGDQSSYDVSTLKAGIDNGKLALDSPIDKSLSWCGLGKESAFSQIECYNNRPWEDENDPFKLLNKDNRLITNFAIFGHAFPWTLAGSTPSNWYYADTSNTNYGSRARWSPRSADGTDSSTGNFNMGLQPISQIPIKNCVLVPMIKCAADISGSPGTAAGITNLYLWEYLDTTNSVNYTNHPYILGVGVYFYGYSSDSSDVRAHRLPSNANFAVLDAIGAGKGQPFDISQPNTSQPESYQYYACGYASQNIGLKIMGLLSSNNQTMILPHADGSTRQARGNLVIPHPNGKLNYVVNPSTAVGVGDWVYYYIDYYDGLQEWIREQIACFGLFFTDDKATAERGALDSDNMFLGILDDNNIGHGKYSRGAKNREQKQWDWSTTNDSDYDPSNPPAIDPNDYDGAMNTHDLLVVSTATQRYALQPTALIGLIDKLWDIMELADPDQSLSDFAIGEFLATNPIDAIVSLQYIPVSDINTGNDTTVVLGKHDTHIDCQTARLTRRVDCGNYEIFPRFGNSWIDRQTKITLYLPFCGTINLDPEVYMGRTINVEYLIDLSNGTCTAIVSFVGDGGLKVITDTASGCCAMDLPVTGIQQQTLNSQLFNATESVKQLKVNNAFKGFNSILNGAMSLGSNNPANAITGILGAGQDLYNIFQSEKIADYNLQHTMIPTKMIGTSGGLTGAMLEYYPTIIFERPSLPEGFDLLGRSDQYAHSEGYACCISGSLSEFTGYTEILNVDLAGFDATITEKNMIRSVLAGGVYL